MNEASKAKDLNAMLLEFSELKARLEDAEATIDAIRTGSIDALIVQGESGEQVFTLKGADEPYRIFVERMMEGAVTLDESGTILYSNKAFANIVGEPLEKVIGTSFHQYFADEIRDIPPHRLAELGRMEATILGPGQISVLCSATPVPLDGPAAFAVTITDMTEQKRHEAALAKATAELEGFCYSVSHDMRAPLRGMISNARIVMEDFGPELPVEAQESLERIAGAAGHLGQLIDDLLTYSRLARAEVRRHFVDITEIANRTAENLLSEGLAWEIERDLSAEGDPRLLELVVYNLLNNAAKFSANSEAPTVRVGWDEDQKAFFVADNGIGFNMDYKDKLFRPFERLHRQQDYPGTGIGLANVKRIISLHGGRVWAEGRPNEGATFYFTLT